MESVIWVTFDHYSSTNEASRHEKCSPGSDLWCGKELTQRFLKIKRTRMRLLSTRISLFLQMLTVIKSIYNNLSKKELLERCIGEFMQNNNESYNQLIWKINPKNLPDSALPVEIATYTSACIFCLQS